MKKLLLSTAAVGLAFAAMPAHAGIDLDFGGYFKGYGAFVDQDEVASTDVNDFDFLKDTELHVTGETTLDNGLTVGFHTEFDVDGADANAAVDESYMYLSSSWGRVNFGEEDGAAYLLQVAAPSADSNVDGLRTYIQPVNFAATNIGAAASAVLVGGGATQAAADAIVNSTELEYAQDTTGKSTKITYLTPVIAGFQGGVSYTPEFDGDSSDIGGVGTTDAAAYDVAARYEGTYESVGFTVGGGYSVLEDADVTGDDRDVWNVGLDLDFGPIGFGVIYKEDETSTSADDEETLVLGADFTTGPFKLGASYASFDNLEGNQDLDAERYTGGVVYTYGPGMTLRGSVSYVEYESGALEDDATSFLIGTQVKF